ncbi:MAG: 2,3-diaminopropionate biosynthesis protein SbnB [Deltaproteobacteria bacterium]|nr:2,3-diaminopropionate biosynthesis protein SbnB [Deltaproteobacteria bacterium]
MTTEDVILTLGGPDIASLLQGKEREIIDLIGEAYAIHGAGDSCLPHSVFVRFPNRKRERIIALPGYLGGSKNIAGIKWIASFPENHSRGISRASAVMVLNSMETGRPQAFMEGSIISAKRTAASAALACDKLHAPGDIDTLGIIGCGLINREIVRYIASLRNIRSILTFDISTDRAVDWAESIRGIVGDIPIKHTNVVTKLLTRCPVVSFATTAVEPTINDLSMCPKGATLLHISLRDLTPEAILMGENVVDDVDHAMRAQTSTHLAEQIEGNRDFLHGTLAQILSGKIPPRDHPDAISIFSPFGLGVLDLTLGNYAYGLAVEQGIGTKIRSFFDAT